MGGLSHESGSMSLQIACKPEFADYLEALLFHDRRRRLLGFERVELGPGEARRVSVIADPRLLARFDGSAGRWRIAGGSYRVSVGRNAEDLVLEAAVPLDGRQFGS